MWTLATQLHSAGLHLLGCTVPAFVTKNWTTSQESRVCPGLLKDVEHGSSLIHGPTPFNSCLTPLEETLRPINENYFQLF